MKLTAAEREFAAAVTPFFHQYCFECHGNDEQEAQINLERMASRPSFASSFKTWQKVTAMLQQGKMPPEDMPQPSDAKRQQLISLIRNTLEEVARQLADDPGPVVMRRLTSAEYAYSIQDLTGLDLNLQGDLVSDAVGGEGFTNIGVVQFVQDSTLERYLDAAKKVAAHAVVGAGPIQFFHDPGKTGFELSAINRIQDIYRAHGFRIAAGEGGEPFGLDRYAKAFYAAWRYRHRERLGLGDATMATIAAEEQIDTRFLEHISTMLAQQSPSFPISDIVTRWQQLPEPQDPLVEHEQKVRSACEDLYRYLHDWQSRLAETASHEEQAAVLTGDSFHVSSSHAFQADIVWEKGAEQASMHISVISVTPDGNENPVVIWRNPRIRFRGWGRRWEDERPLKAVLATEEARQFAFGKRPHDENLGPSDFITAGEVSRHLMIPVPAGARQARLLVEAQLDLQHGDDCVVRCTISDDDDDEKGRNAKTISALLADPDGAALNSFRSGVLEFGKRFPQISHREPAPSDRDPIPLPFDNTYNTRQRDYFHYKVKYHRDDRFLVEHILDDATRQQLDDAWTDLVTSFEYHDVLLRFVADKYRLDLDDRRMAELDPMWIDQLPAEPQQYVKKFHTHHTSAREALAAAQPEHLEDVLRFAERAWRRPLAADENDRLRSYYDVARTDFELDHREAIRALIARVLVAPEFIYRSERPASESRAARLSNWELASRLSYFLWSSVPDAELRRAAAAGELDDPQHLRRQVQRMLRDPKARRFANEFFGQWFGFYQFDRYRGVDPQRFPEFTDQLKAALYDEAVSFFAHIVQDDRPVREILFADYAFLNQDLTTHYGVPLEGTATERVENVKQYHRGGLFGLGAVLTVTSAPLRTSPVKRGDWILRRVLGTPVPPPPADAGSIPADDILSDGLTVRERLEAHRRQPSCANCHSRIDPLGFSLEHYDAIGRWRDRYRDGQAIDDSGTLHDGTHVSGPEGLRNYLLSNEGQFHRTMCTKLLGYSLGRRELAYDTMLIEQMMEQLQDQGRFSSLVEHIVTSVQFRYHQGRVSDQTAAVEKAQTYGQASVQDRR